MAQMKAIRIHSYGGPDVVRFEDAPRPEAEAGEVLVRVHAAGVNPVDWKTRGGGGQAKKIGESFPLVLGWDLSGVVEEVGPEVTSLDTGDEVYGLVRFPQPGATYAEYTAAPAADLAATPASISHTDAAAVPLVALTAWQALVETADLQPGQTVLVHAAAGGVGHIAVQLARSQGARVIGTASGPNADFVRSLGAEPLDYSQERFEEAVSGVDVVLDSIGDEVLERSARVLRRGGILVSIRVELPADAAQELGIRAERIFVRPDGGQLGEIGSLIDAGRLRPVVSAEFPLAEVAKAHELSEAGHTRGKIVLTVRD
jgi:NADPH:quinone reductase-like Zn-dependent oxidoreductase